MAPSSAKVTVPGHAAVHVPFSSSTRVGDVIWAALKAVGAELPASVRGLALRNVATAKSLNHGARIEKFYAAPADDSTASGGGVAAGDGGAGNSAVVAAGGGDAPPAPAELMLEARDARVKVEMHVLPVDETAPSTTTVPAKVRAPGRATYAELVANLSEQLGVPAAEPTFTDSATDSVIDRPHDDATPLWRAGIVGTVSWTATVVKPAALLVVRVGEGSPAATTGAAAAAAPGAAAAAAAFATDVALSVKPTTTVADVTAALRSVPAFAGARVYLSGGGALCTARPSATLRSLCVGDGSVHGATAFRGGLSVPVKYGQHEVRLPVADGATVEQLADAAAAAFGLPADAGVFLRYGWNQLRFDAAVHAAVGPSLHDSESGGCTKIISPALKHTCAFYASISASPATSTTACSDLD